MTTLDTITQPRPQALTQATAVEQARAVAEVAAAVRVAQENPRDETTAIARMRQACGQRALADRAFYSVPRAGGRVEGSSVHLARTLAACWGNIDYGIRELKRDDQAGESEMQAWAWDQESNVRSSRSFVVPHARMVGSARRGDKRRERLDDLGDIANNNNSVAARAVRETIFTILPVWFTAEAESLCAGTLNGQGGEKPLAAQIADAVKHYADSFGVTKTQLEAYVALATGEWTAQTVGGLRVLSGELTRGEKQVKDEFTPAEPEKPRGVTADDIAANTQGGEQA
ncbi:hypothetical protein [Nocardioides soli]|uniref:Uncharacterized protein n=1 Tax=Nocardioides soli TaxID=1036020 RepID=A0A7W4Z0Z1_9ACTN|nr:hypothetical protein [Nocardioides soli]MBB3040985.1 hypothetical protein [Nocardioides soli]